MCVPSHMICQPLSTRFESEQEREQGQGDLQEPKRKQDKKHNLLVLWRTHRPNHGQGQQEGEKIGAELDSQDGVVGLHRVTIRGFDARVPVGLERDTRREHEDVVS